MKHGEELTYFQQPTHRLAALPLPACLPGSSGPPPRHFFLLVPLSADTVGAVPPRGHTSAAGLHSDGQEPPWAREGKVPAAGWPASSSRR